MPQTISLDSSPTSPNTPLSEQTLALVARGLESEAVVGMAEIAKLIETLTVDGLKISVQELAEIIDKDVIVTAKVLSAANLLSYNQSFVPVESVEEAIKLVGFGKIRTLALSLLLMENLRRTGAAAVHRKAATVALTSSLLTQAWAQSKGREDAEYAFLYGSLRQFGDLLLAAFLPDEFQRAQNEGRACGDFNESCRHVFGLTSQDVGIAQLKMMRLPTKLLSSLHTFNPTLLQNEKNDPASQLLLASELSKQVAELTLDEELTAHQYREGMSRARATFQRSLQLDDDTLAAMFAHTEQRLGAFGRAFGIAGVARGIARRFLERREEATQSPTRTTPPLSVEPAGLRPDAAPSETPVFTSDAFFENAKERTLIDTIMEAITAAGIRLASGSRATLTRDLIALCHQTLRACWRTETVLLFWEQSEGLYSADDASGSGVKIGRATFKLGERSVFGVATSHNECVRIHDSHDAGIRPHLPTWFKAELNLRSCLIVPAGEQPGTRLVLCFGWADPRRVTVAPAELRALRVLLGLVVAGKCSSR